MMWIYCMESHQGILGPDNGLKDFHMTVSSTSKPPLDRVLEEGIAIVSLEDDRNISCLNRKEDYFHSEYIRARYQKGAVASIQTPSPSPSPSLSLNRLSQ